MVGGEDTKTLSAPHRLSRQVSYISAEPSILGLLKPAKCGRAVASPLVSQTGDTLVVLVHIWHDSVLPDLSSQRNFGFTGQPSDFRWEHELKWFLNAGWIVIIDSASVLVSYLLAVF